MSGDRPTLLLVDDREENLLALEAILEPLGHRLLRATSGEEALRRLLTDDVATIVLDVQMPGMDGFETAARIKQRDRTRDIPVIFLTAISRERAHRERGFATGAVDYIFKPVDADVLRAKVSVFVDLHVKTRQLEAQRAELAARTDELQRSNHDLEQFVYIASHDLQEPLRVVSGFLELLARRLDDALDERARDWIARARGSTERMSTLIADLLAYARAGGSPRPAVPVALDDALATALDNLGVAIEAAGAAVEGRPLAGVVLASPTEVVQLFQNVVGNAVKFRGAEPPRVVVSARPEAGMVAVTVRDNGRGVPAADVERVFGMFERVEGEPYPGTGLGLAVCRRIVERAGGRIWMQPNHGPGVTVAFTLPAAP